ncbi:hypothetical protein LEN26_015256 [Aphanomyces euteiches]|nr:hypothetical protein LEN26_015256 [Aphanomyces euteiches]KAH9107721.1 hypothetical protein AeMF1_017006 [Aphanomyces euteiches]KAH9196451.1 hypothetical protein AeNC1_001595 [Aphanomyces euteiches]
MHEPLAVSSTVPGSPVLPEKADVKYRVSKSRLPRGKLSAATLARQNLLHPSAELPSSHPANRIKAHRRRVQVKVPRACQDAIAKTSSKSEPAKKQLSLQQLVSVLEDDIQLHVGPMTEQKKKAIEEALAAFDANPTALDPFIRFNPDKNYTRNLVATDDKSYSLIVLCWNKGKYSPIHDHPSDGCWIRHIQGAVNEVRYWNDGDKLVETANMLITEGVTYMNDSLGLHKVGNPSDDVDAVTMHLYAPPISQCRLWHDPSNAARSTSTVCSYDTQFGK